MTVELSVDFPLRVTRRRLRNFELLLLAGTPLSVIKIANAPWRPTEGGSQGALTGALGVCGVSDSEGVQSMGTWFGGSCWPQVGPASKKGLVNPRMPSRGAWEGLEGQQGQASLPKPF